MTRTNRTAGHLLAGFAAVALLAGCHGKPAEDARIRGEQFVPEDQERDLNRFVKQQVASGARMDGMLRPYHFDGPELNSLGDSKLSSMLDDDEAFPVVLYLDMPKDEYYEGRQDSIKKYMKDRGLTDAQFKMEYGPNKKILTPAANGMRAKKLIDSGAPVGINPEPTGSAGATPQPTK